MASCWLGMTQADITDHQSQFELIRPLPQITAIELVRCDQCCCDVNSVDCPPSVKQILTLSWQISHLILHQRERQQEYRRRSSNAKWLRGADRGNPLQARRRVIEILHSMVLLWRGSFSFGVARNEPICLS